MKTLDRSEFRGRRLRIPFPRRGELEALKGSFWREMEGRVREEEVIVESEFEESGRAKREGAEDVRSIREWWRREFMYKCVCERER